MNPEVIIVFVVLAIINSIFNKNKVQKKQQQKRNQQNQQQFGQSGPDQKQKKPDSRNSDDYGLSERRKSPSGENGEKTRQQAPTQRQRPRTLLEEVLQQYNISEDDQSSKPKKEAPKSVEVKAETSKEEDHYTDYSRRDLPKKSRKKKEMKPYSKRPKKGVESGELTGDFFEKTSVEKSEIGAQSFDQLLTFDQQSLARGIIMAEILEKPRSMRKKKVG
jgi:type IV secretory pathway VirB10-like protein